MNKDKIWLSSPHIGRGELRFIHHAFEQNWIAPIGENVAGFEKDLEQYLGGGVFVGALSSGTASIHIGLMLLGVERGDEVVCQSMTFVASANPIMYLGARPVFVDSETDTWNMCPIALESAIKDRVAKGQKPKAIIAVHLYGMPYKADEIRAVAQRYDIPILEDAASALGSSYKGYKCGTLGDVSILSFNGNKIITTSGGGAIITHSEEMRKKAVFLATQARDNAPHYQHSQVGYNYRMSNICAGIGRGQMEVLDEHIGLRRKMHHFYVELFREFPGVRVFSEPSGDYASNHWLSCVVLGSYEEREQLRLAMEKENIETRPLWKPMHLQPVFEGYPYYGGQVAQELFERGLCLPSGSNLTDEDRERIREVVVNCLDNASLRST